MVQNTINIEFLTKCKKNNLSEIVKFLADNKSVKLNSTVPSSTTTGYDKSLTVAEQKDDFLGSKGDTCLHILASRVDKFHQVVEIYDALLNSYIIKNKDVKLSKTNDAGEHPLHLACKSRNIVLFKYLVTEVYSSSSKKIEWNVVSKIGWNALDYAIEYNATEIIDYILKQTNWKDLFRSICTGQDEFQSSCTKTEKCECNCKCKEGCTKDNIDATNNCTMTPMRRLIKKSNIMPDQAIHAFNNCILKQGSTYIFNYEFIDDDMAIKKWSGTESTDMPELDLASIEKNHPLKYAIKYGANHIIDHPLVKGLIHHKWNNEGGMQMHFIEISIYLMYLLFLSVYMTLIPIYYLIDTVKTEAPGIADADRKCELIKDFVDDASYKEDFNHGSDKYLPLLIITGIFALSKVGIEMAKFFSKPSVAFFNYPRIIEWFSFFCLFLFAVLPQNPTDTDPTYRCKHVKTQAQLTVGILCVLSAHMTMTNYIARFPKFGVYVLMVGELLKRLMIFCAVFTFVFLGFLFGWFMLFQNTLPCRTMGSCFVKVFTAMMGKISFKDVLSGMKVQALQESSKNYYKYPFNYQFTMIFLLAFYIMVHFTMYNLIRGIAFKKVGYIAKNMEVKRTTIRIQLMFETSYGLFRRISKDPKPESVIFNDKDGTPMDYARQIVIGKKMKERSKKAILREYFKNLIGLGDAPSFDDVTNVLKGKWAAKPDANKIKYTNYGIKLEHVM